MIELQDSCSWSGEGISGVGRTGTGGALLWQIQVFQPDTLTPHWQIPLLLRRSPAASQHLLDCSHFGASAPVGTGKLTIGLWIVGPMVDVRWDYMEVPTVFFRGRSTYLATMITSAWKMRYVHCQLISISTQLCRILNIMAKIYIVLWIHKAL